MGAFDPTPGSVGDRFGNAIVEANRDRVTCLVSKRVAYATGDDCRLATVVSTRSAKLPPKEDRTAEVSEDRSAKLPDEEVC
jgi:hypothetical protein